MRQNQQQMSVWTGVGIHSDILPHQNVTVSGNYPQLHVYTVTRSGVLSGRKRLSLLMVLIQVLAWECFFLVLPAPTGAQNRPWKDFFACSNQR
jgi:hypothetical protein